MRASVVPEVNHPSERRRSRRGSTLALALSLIASCVATETFAGQEPSAIRSRRAIDLNPNLGGPDDPLSIIQVLRIARLENFTLNDDGSRVAIDVSQLGDQDVWLFETTSGEANKIPFPESSRQAEPHFAPDGERLAVVSDHDGARNVYVTGLEGSTVQRITSHEGSDRLPRFSPDGTKIAFLSREPSGETGWDLWVASVGTAGEASSPRRLTNDPLDEAQHRWSSDSNYLTLVIGAGRHKDRTIARVDLEGRMESLLPDSWSGDAHSPVMSPDGQRIAFVSNASGIEQIYVVPAGGGTPEHILNSPLALSEPAWSPDGNSMAYVENRDGNLRLKWLELGKERARTLTLGPGVRHSPQFTRDGKSILAFAEAPNYPRDVWRFETEGGRARVSETLPSELDVRQFVRPELIRYSSFDDTQITGFLYLPPSASADSPVPMLVRPHGGPTSQWTNGWHGFTQFLTQQGFAVFAPNVRGSTGYGRAFEDLNDGDWGGGDLQDLVAGTRELSRRPEIRSDRIGIWGVSYGGFLTLAAITKYPEMFECAVEAVGMPDLLALYEQTNAEGTSYLDRELGPLTGRRELYRSLSPLSRVDAVQTPLLSFHGQDYPLVPYETKREFFESLHQRTDYRVLEYLFRDDLARSTYRHDLYPAASNAYLEKILEFIRIYL